MPVDVRNTSIVVIAVLLGLFAVHWASSVLIPLILGWMLSYALGPLVDALERWRVPRWLGAGVVVFGVVAGIGWTAYSLADDASTLLQSLPEAAQKLRQSVQKHRRESASTLEKMQRAAAQLEQVASETGSAAPTKGVTRVQIVKPRFSIEDYLWSGTLGLVGFAGQALVVCFLTYFLVASGSSFRRKLVRIAGPTFAQKRITVQALDEITEQVQNYLLVQVLISLLVGAGTWLVFLWIGLEHAAVWGVAAALFNLVPYIGALVVTGAAALFALLQFGTLEMAAAIAAASIALHFVSGYILTPWLTSRTSRLSPVAVFVGVLIWGWLWGVWGMLLGIPLLMMVKAVCDRVEGLKAIGEILGG